MIDQGSQFHCELSGLTEEKNNAVFFLYNPRAAYF